MENVQNIRSHYSLNILYEDTLHICLHNLCEHQHLLTPSPFFSCPNNHSRVVYGDLNKIIKKRFIHTYISHNFTNNNSNTYKSTINLPI